MTTYVVFEELHKIKLYTPSRIRKNISQSQKPAVCSNLITFYFLSLPTLLCPNPAKGNHYSKFCFYTLFSDPGFFFFFF